MRASELLTKMTVRWQSNYTLKWMGHRNWPELASGHMEAAEWLLDFPQRWHVKFNAYIYIYTQKVNVILSNRTPQYVYMYLNVICSPSSTCRFLVARGVDNSSFTSTYRLFMNVRLYTWQRLRRVTSIRKPKWVKKRVNRTHQTHYYYIESFLNLIFLQYCLSIAALVATDQKH